MCAALSGCCVYYCCLLYIILCALRIHTAVTAAVAMNNIMYTWYVSTVVCTLLYCQGVLHLKRYSSCRYNERQLIHVTVVRRVRPRAERWTRCDCEGHRRWKRAGRTLFFCNWFGRASAAEWDFIGYARRRWRRPCPRTLRSCSVQTLQASPLPAA